MRRIGFAFVLVLTVVSAATSAEMPEQVVAGFHAALAKGDAERALSYLDEKVAIYEQGHVENSRAEYASHHLNSDIEFSKAVKNTTHSVDVVVDESAAYVTRRSEATGSFNGTEVHMANLETMVLRKHGDSWKIVHIHWSSRKLAK